ncbi:MAG TPA: DUF2938 family protein [Gammaproteobacteria bacterium]
MREPFVIFFFGGIVGALLMDISESVAARIGISSGVNVGLVGRWAIALAQGTLHHRDIRTSPAQRHEVAAGWLFHLLIGGGGVALLLATLWQLGAIAAPLTAPLPYLLFGLATSVLPWFILLPSFGWGLWGRHGPAGNKALLASPLSHLPYGMGIWLVVVVAQAFFNLTE